MARGTNYSIIFGIIILSIFGSAQIAFAGPGNSYTLTNAPGEGTVTIGVDGFGGFGSFSGPDATDQAERNGNPVQSRRGVAAVAQSGQLRIRPRHDHQGHGGARRGAAPPRPSILGAGVGGVAGTGEAAAAGWRHPALPRGRGGPLRGRRRARLSQRFRGAV